MAHSCNFAHTLGRKTEIVTLRQFGCKVLLIGHGAKRSNQVALSRVQNDKIKCSFASV